MREGHQVETVESGPAALELTLSRAFDLILLDLIMPEMSGFEVLRRLKSAQHTSHVPVIVISALDELDSVVRCIEAGAEDFLTKPFDPILLRARIGACIEKKWLRDREKKFMEELDLGKASIRRSPFEHFTTKYHYSNAARRDEHSRSIYGGDNPIL